MTMLLKHDSRLAEAQGDECTSVRQEVQQYVFVQLPLVRHIDAQQQIFFCPDLMSTQEMSRPRDESRAAVNNITQNLQETPRLALLLTRVAAGTVETLGFPVEPSQLR